jgi:general secretion pathway protein K
MSFPQHGKLFGVFSTAWKIRRLPDHSVENSGRFFHSMENFSRNFPQHGKSGGCRTTVWKTQDATMQGLTPFLTPFSSRGGAALIVALWTVLILSLLVSGLAYEMHIQAGITSYARKRLKAQVAARGGAEYAKFLLAKSFETSAFEEEDLEQESFRILSKNLERGIGVSGIEVEMGGSKARVDILPEAGRRNVNLLQDEDWEELLDQAGVPEEIWPELIDCFMDFTDENDAHRLSGAEADDPFYKSAGYEPKNAPLDTVDELLLIKGFTPEIVYGGPPADPRGEPLRGIAHLLTTFGDGKVNVNTASREVLMTLTTGSGKMMDEWVVDDLLRHRLGDDGLPNTKDDGYTSVQEAISKSGMDPALADKISVSDRKFVRVVSIGDNNGVRMGVWAVFEVGKNLITPIYWREEQMQ